VVPPFPCKSGTESSGTQFPVIFDRFETLVGKTSCPAKKLTRRATRAAIGGIPSIAMDYNPWSAELIRQGEIYRKGKVDV
jgi:hypothetical protein